MLKIGIAKIGNFAFFSFCDLELYPMTFIMGLHFWLTLYVRCVYQQSSYTFIFCFLEGLPSTLMGDSRPDTSQVDKMPNRRCFSECTGPNYKMADISTRSCNARWIFFNDSINFSSRGFQEHIGPP